MTRRNKRLGNPRGWYGVGIERPKTHENLGTLWRSAVCLGASFIFTVGDRYRKTAADTVRSYRHVPVWRFDDLSDFREHVPYDCQTIGVELSDQASPLESFAHPERCVYLLGPEDGSLSAEAEDLCQSIVAFNSAMCLNVASAGSIVMYDRRAKGPTTVGPVQRRREWSAA